MILRPFFVVADGKTGGAWKMYSTPSMIEKGETLLLSITKRIGIIKFMASCLASVGRHPAVQVEGPTIVQALQPDPV